MSQPADQISQQKAELRAELRARRAAQPDKDLLSQTICEKLTALPAYRRADFVLCYLDVRGEVFTREFVARALERGKRIAVPYCTDGRLELFWLQQLSELEPGAFGILEPPERLRAIPYRRVKPADVDLVVVPGVAFDRRGARLGHGHGYYDKLLTQMRPDVPLVALAYECQMVGSLPCEPHDVLVDCIITQREVYYTSGESASIIQWLRHGSFADRVEHHVSLGSTNDRAREAAATLPREDTLLVVADSQTAGRGRGANRWWTGRQSLAFSLLFDPATRGIATRQGPLIALAAALAVIEAVRGRLAENYQLGLHWPNDVFAAGRKLAGVLVEVLPDGRHILGLGCNVNDTLTTAPPEVQEVATSLAALSGTSHDRIALLLEILANLDRTLDELAANSDRLGQAADQFCLQRGRQLTLQLGPRRVTGQCLGIAPDGALVLETDRGEEKFYAGYLIHE